MSTMASLVLKTLLFAYLSLSVSASKPHIIFILVDDNGWAGVGYNNPYLNTPTLDTLAKGGLKLTSHYVYKYCAPTRGAFLTGRLPYRLAATRANFIPWTLPDGTHLNYSMIPRKLQAAGYRSVHIGKWHQGLCTPAYSPVGRGFNHSLGFLEGGEDHNTSKTFGNWCRRGEVDLSYGVAGGSTGKQPYPYTWPVCSEWQSLNDTALHNYYDPMSVDVAGYNPWPTKRFDSAESCRKLCDNRLGCNGYSWRRGDPAHKLFHKCFLISKDGGKHHPSEAFDSAVCRTRPPPPKRGATTLPAWGRNGTYTGEIFAAEAVRVVQEHGGGGVHEGVPLFMYLAMHDTHAPLEAPWSYVAPYAEKFPGDSKRAIFSGMIGFVDAAVKNITQALRDAGMWSNTLFVWTNDNGSPVTVGGSNHPLRGGKGSNWEGGTRVATFVTGGFLPESQRGRSQDGIMHIADWAATLAAITGVDPTANEPHPVAPLDSINMWPWLSGESATSPRTEVILDHRMFHDPTKSKTGCHVVNVTADSPSGLPPGPRCVSAAIRRGRWKLVLGPERQNNWFGWFSPNTTHHINKSSPIYTATACFPTPCLFDLNASMTEHEDLASTQPDIVRELMQRVEEISHQNYHPPVNNPPVDLDGYCAAVNANDNFVGPWMRVQSEFVE